MGETVDLGIVRARAEERIAKFERLRARATELRERVGAVSASATSDDGYITVEVDKRGRLKSLEIDPRVFRDPDSAYLAETIAGTIKQAAEDADRQVEEAMADFVPAEDIRARRNFDFEAPYRKNDERLTPDI